MVGEHPSQTTHAGDDLKPPISGNPVGHEPRCFVLPNTGRYLNLSQYESVHRFNFAAVARPSKIRGRGLAAARQQSSAGGRTNRGIAPTSLSVLKPPPASSNGATTSV